MYRFLLQANNREIAYNASHKTFVNNNKCKISLCTINKSIPFKSIHSPQIRTKILHLYIFFSWVSFNGSLLKFGRFPLFVNALSDICIRYENLQSRTIDRYIRYKRFTTRSD